jgi:hypothetical protein
MIDISSLSTEELDALSKDVKQRQYELEDSSFDEFFQSKDFEYLCKVNSLLMQEQDIEITITVPTLVSVAGNKDETRIDVIASDKGSLVKKAKMREALSQDPTVKRMQQTALQAQIIFDEKMNEFIDKYDLKRGNAWCRIINRISLVKQNRR